MKEVWTVDLNTENTPEQGATIYVVSSKEEALRRVRYLNLREAFGVILEENGDVSDCDQNNETIGGGYCHRFYDVGSFEVDGPFYEEDADDK